MSTIETLLEEGIAAARAGQREEARALLMQVVQADERNEPAWLWLAGVVDDPADMRTCLDNVLDLNPANVKAQQGLAWIDTRYGPRPAPADTPEDTSAQPQPGPSYTGPTTRLEPELAVAAGAAVVLPQPTLPPASPAPGEAAALPENPCPYCGAPTKPSQGSCTQCRNSLMVRAASREQRSAPLRILGALWGISSALIILGGLASIIAGVLLVQTARSFARGGGAAGVAGGSSLIIAAVIPGVLVLLFGGLSIAITRGLLRQARWAYIVNIIFTVLGTIGAVLNVAQGGAMLAGLAQLPSGQLGPNQGRAVAAIGSVLGVALFCLIVWQLLFVVLTVLSHRDFYGPMVRLLPAVEAADHIGHYNSGVAYKNRGMWYMAVKEWEAALNKAPRDMNYLHALGLAYAQIKQLYPHSTQNLQSVKHLLLSRKDELYARAPELERLNML